MGEDSVIGSSNGIFDLKYATAYWLSKASGKEVKKEEVTPAQEAGLIAGGAVGGAGVGAAVSLNINFDCDF